MNNLDCRLFGRIQIIHKEQTIDLKSRKALALVAYLTTTQEPVSREYLVALLWPESDESRARNSLSRTLYQLNRSPLNVAIHANGESLAIDTSLLDIDILQFEKLYQLWKSHKHKENVNFCRDCLHHLNEAVALYHADFLADFYLADANEFEEWATALRERLRRQMLEMLAALSTIYLILEDFDQASHFARRQLALDSMRETAVQQLLQALASAGQKAEALAEFERLKNHLNNELALAPTAETIHLVDAIRQGEFDPAPVEPAAAQLPMRKSLALQRQSDEHRSLGILLERVKHFWVEGVLEHSTHSAALIDLGKELRPGEVAYPWGLVMQRPGEERYELPAGLSMADIFADNGQALLILGAPGSGKTTMLLDLTRSLVNQVETDARFPIPVVFNLSSWRNGSLLAWLERELNEKYLIPHKIGRRWLEEDALALLLDGLDEVAVERRESCIQAINLFRQQHGLVPLLICSRLTEYNEQPTKLKLDNALLLQPLTDQQIDSYLQAVVPRLDNLKKLLVHNPELHELARSPLMLSIMTLTYLDRLDDPDNLLHQKENGRKQLFDNYIKRMFVRRAIPESQAASLTHFLATLAAEMQRRTASIFLVEQLQPSWLPNLKQQISYLILSRFLTFLCLFWGFGVLYRTVAEQAAGIPTIPLRTSYLGWRMSLAAIITTVFISCFWLIREQWRKKRQANLATQWARWLISTLVATSSVIAAILLTTVLMPSLPVGLGPAVKVLGIAISRYEYSFIFMFGLIIGIREADRGLNSDVRPVDTLRWHWRWALLGVLLTAVEFFFSRLFLEESYFSQTVFIALLFTILILGYQVGVHRHPIKPNWGINLSFRYAVRFGLLFFTLFASTVAASRWLYLNLLQGDSTALVPLKGLEIGILMGIAAFFYYGGIELIHHFVLRVMLWQTGKAPFNIVPVLENASHLLFLSKVGGGYLFTHPLLQEHFGTLPTASMPVVHAETPTRTAWHYFRAWRGTAVISILILLLIAVIYPPAQEFKRTGGSDSGALIDPITSIKLTGDSPCNFRTFTPESGRVVVPSLTITNTTDETFVLYWVTKEDPINERFDAVLQPGDSFSYPINEYWSPAYTGNVFCLRDPITGKAARVITVVDNSPVILIEP